MIVDGERAWIALLEPQETNARIWRVGLIFGRTLIAKWHQRIALVRTLASRDTELMSVLYMPPDEWDATHVVFFEPVTHDDSPENLPDRGIGTRNDTVILDELPAYARPLPRDAPYWCSFIMIEVDGNGIYVRFTEHAREPEGDADGEGIEHSTLRLNAADLLQVAISPN
jgi:hypothetical protein